MKNILYFLLIITLLLSSCTKEENEVSWKNYSISDISINIPSDWETNFNTGSGTLISSKSPLVDKNDNYREGVIVSKSTINSLDEFYKSTLSFLRSSWAIQTISEDNTVIYTTQY